MIEESGIVVPEGIPSIVARRVPILPTTGKMPEYLDYIMMIDGAPVEWQRRIILFSNAYMDHKAPKLLGHKRDSLEYGDGRV